MFCGAAYVLIIEKRVGDDDGDGEGGVGLLVDESDLSNVCRRTGKHGARKRK